MVDGSRPHDRTHPGRHIHRPCQPRGWDKIAWRADDLFQTVRDGALKVTIDRRFPLKVAGKAMAYLEARKSKGKLLLDL